MPVREIIYPDNPILRRKANKVTTFDDRLQKLIDDMVETMTEAYGVGLAAPQVAVSQRVIVVRLPDGEDGLARDEHLEDRGGGGAHHQEHGNVEEIFDRVIDGRRQTCRERTGVRVVGVGVRLGDAVRETLATRKPAHDRGDAEGMAEHFHMVLPDQVVGADTQNEESRSGETGHNRVGELYAHTGIEYQVEEVCHFRPPQLLVDDVAHWFLHK